MLLSMFSFFPNRQAARLAGVALAVSLVSVPMTGQDAITPAPAPAQGTTAPVTGNTTVTTGADGQKQVSSTLSVDTSKSKKPKIAKKERVQQTRDTRKEVKKTTREQALVGKDATLPDKALYDKAIAQEKGGHFDVARLDLQTLLNTYPDSQYLMRAKLAVADCWYKEGGSAALTQAEQEFNDFITFFPNAPEAAEAQMRIGDIYFKQMDVPDRDYQKAMKAETAYRTMIRQYPDAPKSVRDEATQKLRDTQEVLATREASIAAFYATHDNWNATIARYDTVIDSYPLYSHMDDALIGKGDAYAGMAKQARDQPTCDPNAKSAVQCLPEALKAKVLQYDDNMAAEAYRKVVLEHAAAPHVEDAKERLASMNLPIPTPTPEQVASSEALEGSRAQYNMKRRIELLIFRRPDTVTAAQIGAPPLDDAPATSPVQVRDASIAALNPSGAPPKAPVPTGAATSDTGNSTAAPEGSTAAPTLNDVPGPGEGNSSPTDSGAMTSSPSSAGGSGTGIGVEVLSPNNGGAPAASGTVIARPAFTPASDLPAASGKADPNFGLKAAAPGDNSALPGVEKPDEAPDQINEAAGKAQPALPAQPTTNAKGKKIKPKTPKEDKADESSSKDKKKKGIDKLNPF